MNTLRVKLRLATILVLPLALGQFSTTLPAAGKLKVGDAFPDLNQFQLEGQVPEATKGKVVLVDFWASWCAPCKGSFPVLEELHQKYGKDGLVIIAINLDDKREQMEEFLSKHAASFLILRDASKKLVGAVNISSMPSSFVLNREGRIVAVHQGFRGDETKKQYLGEIEALLKSPDPKH
jgi:thiol-disulfide isomerase/thioredoxin